MMLKSGKELNNDKHFLHSLANAHQIPLLVFGHAIDHIVAKQIEVMLSTVLPCSQKL